MVVLLTSLIVNSEPEGIMTMGIGDVKGSPDRVMSQFESSFRRSTDKNHKKQIEGGRKTGGDADSPFSG